MSFSVSVLYPNTPGSKFDMQYYLNKHMPLVQERWGPLGLERWEVVEFAKNPQNGEKPYSVQAILHWKNQESLGKATEAHGEEVFGDIPQFTDTQPTLVMGNVVGRG